MECFAPLTDYAGIFEKEHFVVMKQEHVMPYMIC